MRRPVAMMIAGVVTTVIVIGGTIAAVQTGVFASSNTSVQPDGEISVPTALPSPSTAQALFVMDESQRAVNATEPTASPSPAAQSSREALLVQKLNEAYRLMKARDEAYQARLKEAYDKLKASPTATADSAQSAPFVATDDRDDRDEDEHERGREREREREREHDQEREEEHEDD